MPASRFSMRFDYPSMTFFMSGRESMCWARRQAIARMFASFIADASQQSGNQQADVHFAAQTCFWGIPAKCCRTRLSVRRRFSLTGTDLRAILWIGPENRRGWAVVEVCGCERLV
jgi:hypothetical protein